MIILAKICLATNSVRNRQAFLYNLKSELTHDINFCIVKAINSFDYEKVQLRFKVRYIYFTKKWLIIWNDAYKHTIELSYGHKYIYLIK